MKFICTDVQQASSSTASLSTSVNVPRAETSADRHSPPPPNHERAKASAFQLRLLDDEIANLSSRVERMRDTYTNDLKPKLIMKLAKEENLTAEEMKEAEEMKNALEENAAKLQQLTVARARLS